MPDCISKLTFFFLPFFTASTPPHLTPHLFILCFCSGFAGHVAGCGITDEVSQWMENIQNSAVEELPEPMSKDYQKLHRKQLHKKSAPQQEPHPHPHPHPPKKYTSGDDDFKYPHQKYSKEANFAEGAFYDPSTGSRLGSSANVADWHQLVHERVRRATDGAGGSGGSSGGPGRGREDNKNTCSLYIQTDPLIWRHIREGIADVSHNDKQT